MRVLKAEQEVQRLRDYALAITKVEKGSTRKGMAMQLMVQQGADINLPGGEDEEIPIADALRALDAPLVRFLVKAGVDVNHPDPKYDTPLLIRVHEIPIDHADVMKMVHILIDADADVNMIDTRDDGLTRDCTPLHAATSHGYLEVVRALIEAGADVNKGDTEYSTTNLRAAIERDHVEVAQVLIAAGADVNNTNNDPAIGGETPLCIAAMVPSGVNYACSSHRAALMCGVLIEAGADVNKDNIDEGHTPMHVAVFFENVEVVQLLIAAGADLNKVNSTDGQTPLYLAARIGNAQLAQALIAAGADVNKGDTMEWETPLCCANRCNHSEVAKLLVAAGTKD